MTSFIYTTLLYVSVFGSFFLNHDSNISEETFYFTSFFFSLGVFFNLCTRDNGCAKCIKEERIRGKTASKMIYGKKKS